jgi:hypothetical protein
MSEQAVWTSILVGEMDVADGGAYVLSEAARVTVWPNGEVHLTLRKETLIMNGDNAEKLGKELNRAAGKLDGKTMLMVPTRVETKP